MDIFTIESTISNERFIFSKRVGEFFQFNVESEALSATRKVTTYTDEFGIPNLFAKVDEYGSPWEGEEAWESLEGEFSISLNCDVSGHVRIQVKLTEWNSGSEDWHLIVHLNTELGQLKRIAGEARAFFNA